MPMAMPCSRKSSVHSAPPSVLYRRQLGGAAAGGDGGADLAEDEVDAGGAGERDVGAELVLHGGDGGVVGEELACVMGLDVV